MSLSRDGEFLLGKVFDLTQGKLLEDPLTYDPADLTTHGIVTGMTGSGKTGMCVGLLEEAAIEGIPAIIIDPKGDLTNLLLHFPELRSEDFKPWIDPEIARREGKDMGHQPPQGLCSVRALYPRFDRWHAGQYPLILCGTGSPMGRASRDAP
jgi:DNA helicase HerA-like ATPase